MLKGTRMLLSLFSFNDLENSVDVHTYGVVMPPCITYKGSFPKSDYKFVGPDNALYFCTETVYINNTIYLVYIKFLGGIIPGR